MFATWSGTPAGTPCCALWNLAVVHRRADTRAMLGVAGGVVAVSLLLSGPLVVAPVHAASLASSLPTFAAEASPGSADAAASPTAATRVPEHVVVVAAAGVDAAVVANVRAALSARGAEVPGADETRASLDSARALGLDCDAAADAAADAGNCWRRVAALAHEDAAVVVEDAGRGGGGAGSITLRFLDARADVEARTATGAAADVDALVARLFARPASPARASAAPPAPAAVAAAPATTSADEGPSLASVGIGVAAVSGALALVSGAGALVIQQTVLSDPAASGATKGTAFGAGVVLLGATAVFAVGAVAGGAVAWIADSDDDNNTRSTSWNSEPEPQP